MESDLLPSSEGINGINLANYFPNRRSYNSVVYFHKRFLRDIKEERPKDIKRDEKPDKGKKKKNVNKMKYEKSQQFNSETMNQQSLKYDTAGPAPCNNSVLDHTIRFAKNLAPLVLPKDSAVFYTIKSSKKHRKSDRKAQESSVEQDVTYNKDKFTKTGVVKHRKKHKGSSSHIESIDPSSQNTLEDVHININQSCSFSESTEVKFHKKASNHYKVTNESSQKIFISNSFEALATESISDGNKIKIHLMNESDKNLFSESLQNPIIDAIKDYLTRLNLNNSKDLNADLKNVQKLAKINSQKLDAILEKLACIQNEIDDHAKLPSKETIPRTNSAGKASRLEELGQDIIEIKGQYTSEEEDFTEAYNNLLQRRKNKGKSVVMALDQKGKEDKKKDSLACGEDVPGPLDAVSSISQLGIKPDRPNRIPARFCWTDADRKK